MVKNPPAGDARDMGSIPGSGRSSGGGHACVWTEEPGMLQPMGSQRVRHK